LREAREKCLSTGHYLSQVLDFIEMVSWLAWSFCQNHISLKNWHLQKNLPQKGTIPPRAGVPGAERCWSAPGSHSPHEGRVCRNDRWSAGHRIRGRHGADGIRAPTTGLRTLDLFLACHRPRQCPYNGYKSFQRTNRPIRKLSSQAREVQLDYRQWTTKATPAAIHAFTLECSVQGQKIL
jgi:hypothetical protein